MKKIAATIILLVLLVVFLSAVVLGNIDSIRPGLFGAF